MRRHYNVTKMAHYLSSGSHKNYKEIIKTVLFHEVTYQCLPFSKTSFDLEIGPFLAYTVPSSLYQWFKNLVHIATIATIKIKVLF